MLTQSGYALGLIFLVPLGDLVDRCSLVISQGVLLVFALVGIAMTRA